MKRPATNSNSNYTPTNVQIDKRRDKDRNKLGAVTTSRSFQSQPSDLKLMIQIV